MDSSPALTAPRTDRRAWRVARRGSTLALRLPRPLSAEDPGRPIVVGNRFDPPDGHDAFLNVADTLDRAYMEVLHNLRAKAETERRLSAVTGPLGRGAWMPVDPDWWRATAHDLAATREVVTAVVRAEARSIDLNAHQTFRYLSKVWMANHLVAASLPLVVDNGVVLSPDRH